jgi:nucleotide-binding universal stress UspA family protein
MDEIICGVDESTTALDAARHAAAMANAYGRPLHLVTALTRKSEHMRLDPTMRDDRWFDDSFGRAEDSLQAIAKEIGVHTRVTMSVLKAHPGTALCDEARRLGAAVIVVGNKRTQGVSRILGSIATDVVTHAPCDVFIVHTNGKAS